MKDSSRSVSRRIGGGFRVESFARYAEYSFSGFIELEKHLERPRESLHMMAQTSRLARPTIGAKYLEREIYASQRYQLFAHTIHHKGVRPDK
jgi:hypothetical protein